jgi:hypothetical protein
VLEHGAKVFEAPQRWPAVLSVRFGSGNSQLGSIQAKRYGAPAFPKSFTVVRDGSFWILDIVKDRLAHYSRHGEYLGYLRGGLHFDTRHLIPKGCRPRPSAARRARRAYSACGDPTTRSLARLEGAGFSSGACPAVGTGPFPEAQYPCHESSLHGRG